MTDPESDQYPHFLAEALEALTSVVKQCQTTYTTQVSDTIESATARKIAHNTLVLQAYRFLLVAQGPCEAACSPFEWAAQFARIRSLLEMGAFDALPIDGGSRTVQELAHELNVDESLLNRLLRSASTYGPFEETGPGEYRHTPFSQAYMRPDVQGLFKFGMDDHCISLHTAHEYLKASSWKEPSSTSSNPYTYAHHGLSMFTNLTARPARMKAFNDGMTYQATTALWMIDLFPWAEFLAQLHPDPSTSVVVDVGGGKGKAILRIRELCKGIPGRYILEDQGHVVESAKASLPREDAPSSAGAGAGGSRVEAIAYDFHTEQPVKGALIYTIRRCLHNWPDAEATNILKNIADAMNSTSRLLMEEIIVPEQNIGLEEAWMDMIMMSIGAKQRTRKEWTDVLGKAELEIVKVWQIEGSPHGLIEARVKGCEGGDG